MKIEIRDVEIDVDDFTINTECDHILYSRAPKHIEGPPPTRTYETEDFTLEYAPESAKGAVSSANVTYWGDIVARRFPSLIDPGDRDPIGHPEVFDIEIPKHDVTLHDVVATKTKALPDGATKIEYHAYDVTPPSFARD